jgi:hypothetical protein
MPLGSGSAGLGLVPTSDVSATRYPSRLPLPSLSDVVSVAVFFRFARLPGDDFSGRIDCKVQKANVATG